VDHLWVSRRASGTKLGGTGGSAHPGSSVMSRPTSTTATAVRRWLPGPLARGPANANVVIQYWWRSPLGSCSAGSRPCALRHLTARVP